ncbi:MAG: hypothetical protein KDK70_31545 [Myxococcales bacterium]|nr:hypothetical protein [Myxococcales bacterium]
MDRLASHLFIATLLSLPIAACGDDPGTGGGTETESSTGSTGSTTATSNSTTSSMTNMTMGGSSGTSDPTTGADSTGTTDPGSTSNATSTSTGGDECEACQTANCGDEVAACAAEPDCQCWVDCLAEGNDPPQCGMMCDGMPPGEFGDLNDCIDANCDVECNGGGQTTGGMDGETYMPCNGDNECPMTDCSGFVGYCSLDCMDDANNCPMPATGNIEPICGGMQNNRCLLPCGGGGDMCPDGMNCQGGGGGGGQFCGFN